MKLLATTLAATIFIFAMLAHAGTREGCAPGFLGCKRGVPMYARGYFVKNAPVKVAEIAEVADEAEGTKA
jgi:hypothetical protein